MTSLDNLRKFDTQASKGKHNEVTYDDFDLLIDLIKQCLRIDPKQRITPAQALKHPFFKGRSIIQPLMRNNTNKKAEGTLKKNYHDSCPNNITYFKESNSIAAPLFENNRASDVPEYTREDIENY